MSDVVVEVGPDTVRGPNVASSECISAALECIDDDLALIDDRPVPVPELWTELMCTVADDGGETVVLVCPTWWSTTRIERVRAAAHAVASTVVVWRRSSILRETLSPAPTSIVEFAGELVVVTHPGARAVVVPLFDGAAAAAQRVAAAVGISTAVLIDVPSGLRDGAVIEAVAARLSAHGVAVTRTAEDAVRQAAAAGRSVAHDSDARWVRPRRQRHRRATAVVTGVAATVAVGGGFVLSSPVEAPTGATRLLVEGRIGVAVPAAWPVQRIISGPGSARLQLVSPSDPDVALHLTQSPNVPDADLGAAAASLSTALAAEPEGVFVDFEPSVVRAGRAAVAYREVRPQRRVAWTVLVEGSVRIAIGCQSAPGREHLVRDICDRAISSARQVSGQ